MIEEIDPAKVFNDEELSRFIFEEGKYTQSTGNINHRIFLPRYKAPIETSVFRTSALKVQSKIMWDIGFKHAGAEVRIL